MSKRIKVLAYCDSPSVSTGFATVSKNILMGLHNTGLYDITVLGVNYWGIPHSFPFPIFPVGFNEQKDPYGRQKVCGMIMNMEFDILFFLQDTFILDFLPELHTALRSKGKKFKSIVYYPIDSPSKKEWIDNVKVCDYVVAYSQYGKDITVGFDPSLKDISVIPHGVNFNDFHPVNKQEVDNFRRQYFGPVADKWIVTNVSRNQQRKDIPRCISAFKEFKKQVPNSVLYIHAAFRDQGGDLKEVVDAFGLSTSKDVIFPERFSPNQGYPIHVLNMIYNASDCVISTTTGEGFGLCVIPETNVTTENGVKFIKDLTICDKVLSSNGTYNSVEHIMSRPYNGDIFSVTTWLSNIPIKTSPEHGFKVLENGKYIWKQAKDLRIGDNLLFPKNGYVASDMLNIFDLVLPKLNIFQKNCLEESDTHFRINSKFKAIVDKYVPKQAKITPSLMRLFGLYLAEGSVSTSKMDSILFSFHKKEEDILNFVIKEMKNVFGIEGVIKTSRSRGEDYQGVSVVFYSSIVAALFMELFGSGARNKKVHSLLLNQNDVNLKEFVYGEFIGDGYYSNSTSEMSFSTTSKSVAYSLRFILAKIGVMSSVRTSRVEYKINVSGKSRRLLLDMFGISYRKVDSSGAYEKAYMNDDYIILPIKNITMEHSTGFLVDIQVANTNDFVAENVVVHNSWLEGMATKTPVIMPVNTMLPEFITNDTGWLYKSGGTPNLYHVFTNDNEVIRPLADIDDLVKTMVEVYNNKAEVDRRVENAYSWVKSSMGWQEHIVPMWLKIFKAASKQEESVAVVDDVKNKIIEAERF